MLSLASKKMTTYSSHLVYSVPNFQEIRKPNQIIGEETFNEHCKQFWKLQTGRLHKQMNALILIGLYFMSVLKKSTTIYLLL